MIFKEILEKAKPFVWIVFLAAFIAIGITLLSTFLPGCMSTPKRANYSCNECYMEADCLYRNKDNKDKSNCAGHIEDCRKVDRDLRAKAILKYCKEEKPGSWSEGECQKYFLK